MWPTQWEKGLKGWNRPTYLQKNLYIKKSSSDNKFFHHRFQMTTFYNIVGTSLGARVRGGSWQIRYEPTVILSRWEIPIIKSVQSLRLHKLHKLGTYAFMSSILCPIFRDIKIRLFFPALNEQYTYNIHTHSRVKESIFSGRSLLTSMK